MKIIFKNILIFGFLIIPIYAASQDCKKTYSEGIEFIQKKEFESAINKFKAAKICDKNLEADCNTQITLCEREIQKIAQAKIVKPLEVNKKTIDFPADGGSDKIIVSGGGNWVFENDAEWCNVTKSNNTLTVVCDKINDKSQPRITHINIKSGKEARTIQVIQNAAEEFLKLSSDILVFSSRGNEGSLTVETNSDWNFSSPPFWCEVSKNNNSLVANAKPNNTDKERTGKILINSGSKALAIDVFQNAGEDTLDALVKEFKFPNSGGKSETEVYCNEEWSIHSIPSWCSVKKTNDYTIRIECDENKADKARNHNIQVRAGKQKLMINIYQSAGLGTDKKKLLDIFKK